MFSLVDNAFAMAPPTGAEVSTVDTIMSFAPLILLLFIFYVFIIRPQGKKQQETKQMIENLKEGDRVLTSGGIIGTIVKVKDDELTVEIAKEVKVKINKNYVSSLVTKSI
ncbi:MAG: preprotein translocase subunit YajC [Nitrospinota bacterium]|nr:preprotein translocase subunit YajC [Nitrospinota bacterium]